MIGDTQSMCKTSLIKINLISLRKCTIATDMKYYHTILMNFFWSIKELKLAKLCPGNVVPPNEDKTIKSTHCKSTPDCHVSVAFSCASSPVEEPFALILRDLKHIQNSSSTLCT